MESILLMFHIVVILGTLLKQFLLTIMKINFVVYKPRTINFPVYLSYFSIAGVKHHYYSNLGKEKKYYKL